MNAEVNPDRCSHRSTVIDRNELPIVEECIHCGHVLEVIEEDGSFRCGSTDTNSGDPCQRTVKHPNATCHEHE